MSNTISKYVGTFVDLSDGYKKIYGNCFFINSYTVVTALHVIERLEKNRFAMLYKGKERVVDPDRIERYEQYDLAIIWFDEDIVDTFNNHYLFDIKEDIGNESVDWKMEGYLPIGNGSKLLSISGNQSYLDSPTKIVFSEVNELHYDLRGMSGSPVCINDLIVGVFTDQKTVDNVVKEVIITPTKLIADRIDKALIGENIFSHKLTPKINYAVELQDYFKRDKYFERRCKQYDGVDYHSLFTKSLYGHACDSVFKRNIVIVGEAGIGKTYELMNMAVRLYDYKEIHPIYFMLADFHSGIHSLNEISKKIIEYIDSGTPFCLLLDGFDEINNSEESERFRRLINSTVQNGNNGFSIIISSRKNFFRHDLFRGFFELELCPLHQHEVIQIVKEKEVAADRFFAEVEAKHLEKIVEYPFYLDKLIEVFKEDNTLPDKAHLMETIIDKVLQKCYIANGNLGEGLAQTDNKIIKNYLSKIAIAMHYMGKNTISGGDFNIIATKIDDHPRIKVLEKCGLIGLDAFGNRYFVHRNFFEFLVAKYINEQYKEDLTGLVSVIQNNEQTEIFPEYRNIVSYIVDIRESGDLMEWLLNKYPTVVDCFESDKYDKAKLLDGFTSVFQEYADKGYYSEVDGGSEIERWAKISDCDEFLISKIESSQQENELVNALHLLRVAEIKSDNRQRIVASLLKLTNNAPSEAIVIRIVRLVCAKQIDDGICDSILEKYSSTQNEWLIKLICEYLTAINRADDFADFVIGAISKCANYNIISYDIVDCIGSFVNPDSLRAFLAFALESVSGSRSLSCLSKLFSKSLSQNLYKCFISGDLNEDDRKALEKILAKECMRWDSKILQVWSQLFVDINCEESAIEDFFEICDNRAWEFVILALDYPSFTTFICEKIREGEFDNRQGYLLMCIQKIPEDNPKRIEIMDCLRKDGGKIADSILTFFSDLDQEEQKDEKQIELEMIFDIEKPIQLIRQLIDNSGKDDFTFNELLHAVYGKRTSATIHIAFNLIDTYVIKKDSVLNSFSSLAAEEMKKEFFISSLSKFIKANENYREYMTDEQVAEVTAFCNDYIHKTHFEEVVEYKNNNCFIKGNTAILESVIHVVSVLNLEVSKEKRLEMVYLPISGLIGDSYTDVPGLLKDYLQAEEIIAKIKEYYEKEKINGMYTEICLEYGANLSYLDETLLSIAEKTLLDYDQKYYHRAAWDYLESVDRVNTVTTYIIEGKISPKILIDRIESLVNYPELSSYFSELFEKMESDREEIQKNEEYSEYIKKEYPFIFDYDYSDNQSNIISSLEYFLQRIFIFFLQNNSERHIKYYLNEMIEKQCKSHLDYDDYETNLQKISDVKYLDLLIELFIMMTEGRFKTSNEYSTFYSDILCSFDKIAENNREAVVCKMNELTESTNLRVKRAAYNFLRTKEVKAEAPTRDFLDAYSAADKVHNETGFYPFM